MRTALVEAHEAVQDASGPAEHRQADSRFHLALAAVTDSPQTVRAVTAVQANEPAWGETLDYMMVRWARDMGVPYLGRAEVGHTQANHVVPFGVG